MIWEENICKVPNTIPSTLIFLFAVLNVACKFLYYIKQFICRKFECEILRLDFEDGDIIYTSIINTFYLHK